MNELLRREIGKHQGNKILKSSDLREIAVIEERLLVKYPQIPGFDIAVWRQVLDQVGGDGHDFIKLPNNRYLLYIADVSGHGLSASMVMGMYSMLISTLARQSPDPRRIMLEANTSLQARIAHEIFITSLLGVFSKNSQFFQYCSAGHTRLIHYRKYQQRVKVYPAAGIALGMVDQISHLLYNQLVLIRPGDYLVLYSDGLTEAKNQSGEQFGLKRLVTLVQKLSKIPQSNQFLLALQYEWQRFTFGRKLEDDVTLLVVRKN